MVCNGCYSLNLNPDTWGLVFRDIGTQETPLHLAAMYGHASVMELIIERGANVHIGTTKGFTSLHAASYTGQTECIQILINHSAKIDAATVDNWLPLHCAALRGKLTVVELFLKLGVAANSMTTKQKSGLHLAAYAGHVSVVRLLVEHKVDIEAKSHKGETPLHLATRAAKPEVVEFLLSVGASRSAVTNEGKTALDVAQASGLTDAKEVFRIVQTYGLPGYQPWQPPQDPNASATSTTTATGDDVKPDLGARRNSAVSSTARTFGHVATPGAHTIQANLSVKVQPAPQTSHGVCNPTQPAPTGTYLTPPAEFSTMQTNAMPVRSKFSYDATANIRQDIPRQETGVACGSAPPPTGPPPPYTPSPIGMQGYAPSTPVPEKSSGLNPPLGQSNSGSWQSLPSFQASPVNTAIQNQFVPSNGHSFQPLCNTQQLSSYSNPGINRFQGNSQPPISAAAPTPSTQAPPAKGVELPAKLYPPIQTGVVSNLTCSLPISSAEQQHNAPKTQNTGYISQNASTPHITTSPPSTAPQQTFQSSTLQIFNAQPTISGAPPSPALQPYQPTAFLAVASYQQPLSPNTRTYQASSSPDIQSYQPPPSPSIQQYQSSPLPNIQEVQAPLSLNIQTNQPPPSPMQATRDLALNTNYTYKPPTAPNTNPQLLSPSTPRPAMNAATPSLSQNFSISPIQPHTSPLYNGQSTASTYRATYEYGNPTITQLCNPNLDRPGGSVGSSVGYMAGASNMDRNWGQPNFGQPRGRQQSPGNGMVFAPPPTAPVLGKKKSFLGGLLGG